MGEKFAAIPARGTASLTVPLPLSPGRGGFGPQLSLTYDSGSGNGAFGLGWDVPVAAVTRKTDKGVPLYRDGDESDVYILSGAEDLVPVLDAQRDWQPTTFDEPEHAPGYRIDRYRPRVEGLFARIERWTRKQDNEIHWRSISRDNITSLYGKDDNARIFDAPDIPTGRPKRVFSWLLSESFDDRGNAVVYEYAVENSDEVDEAAQHERNRGLESRRPNRYLKRIKYGNRVSRLVQPDLALASWMFEAVFDYGDHASAAPTPNDGGHWLCRNDPFSSYRAGFEVRTYRLCQRVLMFHHFPDDTAVGSGCLVRSVDIAYRESRGIASDRARGHPVVSVIAALRETGYSRHAESGYIARSLPPIEFTYSADDLHQEVLDVDPRSLDGLPTGLNGTDHHWLDLDGDGLSGVLIEQQDGWYFKRNLSQLPTAPGNLEPARAAFGPLEHVASHPTLRLADSVQMLDLAGDGQLDLVALSGSRRGFFERSATTGWKPFRPFTSFPNRNVADANLRFVDLTGDGLADLMVTEDDALTWYQSLAEDGFGPGHRVLNRTDEDQGPRLLAGDNSRSIALADMSGDGLTDLVHIRTGEVCYWPNLGHGRFGAKVTMDGAPRFDEACSFDPRRIRLGDIDGSGTTDIFYIGTDRVTLWRNQSGNRWSAPHVLTILPPVDSLASIAALDFLGSGTACLVWSSARPGDARRPMRYVDLMGGRKPHLLVGLKNNLGAETHIHYAPSTRFSLLDKAAGRPWRTRLPYPVQVVERIETYDAITRSRHQSRMAYHDGYFDGVEREFRGFGMVEQWDSEVIDSLLEHEDDLNWDDDSFVPPALTKTWFHTGAFGEGSPLSTYRQAQYYEEGDPSRHEGQLEEDELRQMRLPDSVLPAGLSPAETREAYRALKGMVLRQEVYGRDESEASDRPYLASERNYTIRCEQPQTANRHAVFFVHPRETVEFHYERCLYDVGGLPRADPRVSHAVTLAVDPFGNVEQGMTIAYGRRFPDPDSGLDAMLTPAERQLLDTEQAKHHLGFAETRYTTPVFGPNVYRPPLACDHRVYEIRAADPTDPIPNVTNLYRFAALETMVANVCAVGRDVPYEDLGHVTANGSPSRRLIEHTRTLFKGDGLHLLALGQLDPLVLPGESYQLALTPGLLASVYARSRLDGLTEHLLTDAAADLAADGGYVASQTLRADGSFPPGPDDALWSRADADGHWWVRSGQMFYHPEPGVDPEQAQAFARDHFYFPHRLRDPFNNDAWIAYDEPNRLVPIETRDPVGSVTRAHYDYRTLKPRRVVDANQNVSVAAFDALGNLVGTATVGKEGEDAADTLNDFVADIELDALQEFVADPLVRAPALLASASTRVIHDVERFARCGQPPFAATLLRETHARAPQPDTGLKIQIGFTYSDGFGREIQSKIQAEPGDAPGRQVPVPVRHGGPPGTGDLRPGPLVLENGRPRPMPIDSRWVSKGRTVFNNKGSPVKQYEPFFSATHLFEDEREVTDTGVTPVIFYDSIERPVATLRPNHTYEKTVFDPWRQERWDVNDTVAADPRSDDQIQPFVHRYFAAQPVDWQTWHGKRVAGLGETVEERQQQRDAATRAVAHAGTPAHQFLDSLGRTILVVAHNRSHNDGDVVDEYHVTSVEIDIEGNRRGVIDARGNRTYAAEFDLRGNVLHTTSADAGEAWMLPDVSGTPVRAWDDRGFNRLYLVDRLRRSVGSIVRGVDPADPDRAFLFDLVIYGDRHPQSAQRNLRGRLWMQFDHAGLLACDRYDFKGNLLRGSRRFARNYTGPPDWSPIAAALPPDPADAVDPVALLPALLALLEPETFTNSTVYDALDRPLQVVAPHSSQPGTSVNVIRPIYNAANLLNGLDVWLELPAEPTGVLDPISQPPAAHGVANIDYNARGQRTRIDYKNRVSTTYDYDPETLRLTRLRTNRLGAFPAGRHVVQDLRYTYDPVGNVTHIGDKAQDRIFHANACVDAEADFLYDAVYRLIAATGREHRGDNGAPGWNDDPRFVHALPASCEPLQNYVETYRYDAVGNILAVRHHRGHDLNQPGVVLWHRRHQYALDGNRLLGSSLPGELELPTYAATSGYGAKYGHDPHGNMTSLPHLTQLEWDASDRLRRVDLGGGGTAYYTYDAGGRRLRKVWEKAPGLVEERLTIGGFELFRRRNGAGMVTLARETLHLIDDQQRVALVETRTIGIDPAPRQLVRYQHGNQLSSATLELDDQARVVTYEEYYPFGSTAYQATRTQTETPKRYRYTAKERDEETGFADHGARLYAPWLGRWTACDPHGAGTGANLYTYARCNPLTTFDPDGKDDVPVSPEALTKEQVLGVVRQAKGMDDLKKRLGLEMRTDAGLATYLNQKGVSADDLQKALIPTPREEHTGPSVGMPKQSRDQLWAQRVERDKAERRASHPNQFDVVAADSARVAKVVDPSQMGIVKPVVTVVYMVTDDQDIQTANANAANVDAVVNVVAIMSGAGAQKGSASRPTPVAPPPGESQSGAPVSGTNEAPAPTGLPQQARAAQLMVQGVRAQQRPHTTISVSPAISAGGEPVNLVASTVALDPTLLFPGEVLVTDQTGHAEIQTIHFARAKGFTLLRLHPSRPFCANCAFWARQQGVAPSDAMVAGRPAVPLQNLTNRDLGARVPKAQFSP